MQAHDRSQLVLEWQDDRARLSDAGDVLHLGSAGGAHLVVPRRFASRRHATIERRKEDFVLVDHSTNGTFVQTEDEQVAFLRRGEIRLWGAGWISLGEPLTADSAIHYQNV